MENNEMIDIVVKAVPVAMGVISTIIASIKFFYQNNFNSRKVKQIILLLDMQEKSSNEQINKASNELIKYELNKMKKVATRKIDAAGVFAMLFINIIVIMLFYAIISWTISFKNQIGTIFSIIVALFAFLVMAALISLWPEQIYKVREKEDN